MGLGNVNAKSSIRKRNPSALKRQILQSRRPRYLDVRIPRFAGRHRGRLLLPLLRRQRLPPHNLPLAGFQILAPTDASRLKRHLVAGPCRPELVARRGLAQQPRPVLGLDAPRRTPRKQRLQIDRRCRHTSKDCLQCFMRMKTSRQPPLRRRNIPSRNISARHACRQNYYLGRSRWVLDLDIV